MTYEHVQVHGGVIEDGELFQGPRNVELRPSLHSHFEEFQLPQTRAFGGDVANLVCRDHRIDSEPYRTIQFFVRINLMNAVLISIVVFS